MKDTKKKLSDKDSFPEYDFILEGNISPNKVVLDELYNFTMALGLLSLSGIKQ